MQPAIACIANPNKIKTNVSKKKSLTRVVWAFVFLIFALPETSFANVVITAPSLTLTACGSFPTSYSALGNIVITEGSNGDFATGNNKTLILTAPANFEFQAGIGSVSFLGGANLSNTSITVTTTTITVQYDVNNNNRHDVLTISGINVRGITAAASNRTVTRTGGTGTITADVNGTVHATLTSQLVSIPSVTTPTAQSSCSGSATNIALASSPSGASFTWTLGTVTNASGAVAGSGTNIAQTLTSTGTPSSVQYIVTPTLNGCTGSSTTITNTINPKPNMTSASTATVCSGATVSIG
ncbi:MAG TPA: PKD-like domain-containing protein, partial [Chitinophagaceae bacterium]